MIVSFIPITHEQQGVLGLFFCKQGSFLSRGRVWRTMTTSNCQSIALLTQGYDQIALSEYCKMAILIIIFGLPKLSCPRGKLISFSGHYLSLIAIPKSAIVDTMNDSTQRKISELQGTSSSPCVRLRRIVEEAVKFVSSVYLLRLIDSKPDKYQTMIAARRIIAMFLCF